jgi:DNA primase
LHSKRDDDDKETEFFKKGQNLYNYSRARKAIYDRKFAVIVEGYMDVISLSRYKIENVVAPLGTSVTVEQLKDLFKITSEIIIFLDGDAAGIKASRRVIDITLPILNPKNIVRFAFLPNGADPDDFVKINGSKAVEDLLAQAKNLSEVLLEYEAKDLGIKEINRFTSPEKKAMLETRLMDKINLITDPNSKKHFSQYYRNIVFGFSKKNDSQTLINSKNNFLVSALNQFRILDSEFIYGANIIAILIKHPNLIDYNNEYYDLREVSFSSEELNNVKESLVELWDKNRVVNANKEDLASSLEEICYDYQNLKEMMPHSEKISDDFNEAKQKLEIF